ncbi:MAG: 2Fe-2S iron-sulfur cluster binding domain-containing protein [Hydrogenophilales bacterium]|nr:2Fe-2S iron-sulfur cluster binding domain-containing protein [Hydrogenophilales bacterium]
MAKLLNLHRAARLVGVTRGALQKKIQNGELDSFDGMVTLDELHRAYPHAALEDNTVLKQIEQIKDSAFSRRIMDRTLPDKEVLAARLHDLSKELVESKALLNHVQGMLSGISSLLDEWAKQPGDRASAAASLQTWLHEQRLQAPPPADASALMIRDNFLRVISAQIKALPSGSDFFVEGNDTILEAALRAGIPLAYGCSSGSCGACKARVLSGEIKQVRSHDYVMPPAQQALGYALMCSCTAVSDLVLEADVAQSPRDLPTQQLSGEVRALEQPTDEVAVIHIKTPPRDRLRFLAGQRAVLTLGGSLAEELPIASCPCEDRHLEFHVRRLHGNHFSDFVFEQLKAGDSVSIRGPSGNFVLDTASSRPILFIAFCTGFAPIKSLMEHAMALDQAETIHLLWIATQDSGLYLPGLARAWADALDNFTYTPILVGGDLDATASRQEGVVVNSVGPVLSTISTLMRADIYIAGPSLAVSAMTKHLLRLGVPEARIFADHEG